MYRIRLIFLLGLPNLLTDREIWFRQQRFWVLFGRCQFRTDWRSWLRLFMNFLSSFLHISGWCLELDHDRLLLHPLTALILRHSWRRRVALGQVFLRSLLPCPCQCNTKTSVLIFFFFNRHCNPCGFWPAQLSLSILSRKVFTECRCQRHVKLPTWRTSD